MKVRLLCTWFGVMALGLLLAKLSSENQFSDDLISNLINNLTKLVVHWAFEANSRIANADFAGLVGFWIVYAAVSFVVALGIDRLSSPKAKDDTKQTESTGS